MVSSESMPPGPTRLTSSVPARDTSSAASSSVPILLASAWPGAGSILTATFSWYVAASIVSVIALSFLPGLARLL